LVPFAERRYAALSFLILLREIHKDADTPQSSGLPMRRHWTRRRTAQQRDELPPLHVEYGGFLPRRLHRRW
jgi:hypothetical protein